VTLRAEHRLKVSENRVLRGILALKRCKGSEDWRRVHNEELHDSHSLPNVIRKIKFKEDKMSRVCSTNGEEPECIYEISGEVRRKESTWNSHIYMYIYIYIYRERERERERGLILK
jgi:hypothetical protein